MTDSPLVARWQRRLDRAFPLGAVCSWLRPGTEDAPITYLVPRLEVTGMSGLDPLVRLVCADSDRVLGAFRVLSHELLDETTWKVIFEDVPDPMLWVSAVPPRAAREMAPLRARYIRAAPHGGSQIFTGVPDA